MSLADHVDLVVFDFDGTICDSVGVKNEAFRLLYLDEHGEDFAARVLAHHLANVGVSRYDKIRHVEEHLLGEPATDDRVEAVAQRFAALVFDGVVAAPLIPGAAEFLARHAMGPHLTLASATPTGELRAIVEAKRLTGHFAAVDGSPAPKGEIAARHVARFAAGPARVVLVGDQESDVAAAAAAGVAFVGVRSEAGPGPFPDGAVVVPDLTGLDDAIERAVTRARA